MALLVLSAVLWLAIHIGLSGTRARDVMAGRIGERGFPGVFTVLAVAALALLIYAYRQADTVPLWYAPPWLVGLIDAIMLVALVLFSASVIPARGTAAEPRGIFRVTRHPMLCSFALWAGAHMLGNGDTASLVFFGTFLVTVLAGIPSLDAKLARRDPGKAAALHGRTSRLPFAAILAGRNRLSLSEIGWLAPMVGVVAWVALGYLHPVLLGMPAFPG